MDLRACIREIEDFPRQGVLFRDITPLLANPDVFAFTVERLQQQASALAPDVIIGIEARGFLFAAPLALRMHLPYAPIRKLGKLPCATYSVTYALEYGTDSLQIHRDAVAPKQRVLLVDDLLATGGTLLAACQLIEKADALIAGIVVVAELTELKGRQRLSGATVSSLIRY